MAPHEINYMVSFLDKNFSLTQARILPNESIQASMILDFTLGGLQQVLKSKYNVKYEEAKRVCSLWKRRAKLKLK